MEVYMLIAGIISILVIIKFFSLAGDVAAIKRHIQTEKKATNSALAVYHQKMFWGDKQTAVQNLKEAFWFEFSEIKAGRETKEQKLTRYETLKTKYGPAFEKQGIDIPQWNGETSH